MSHEADDQFSASDYSMFDTELQPMAVLDWVIVLVVLAIPMVNIVMYVYWGFFSPGNINRKTFCQASILLFVVLVGISVFFGIAVSI